VNTGPYNYDKHKPSTNYRGNNNDIPKRVSNFVDYVRSKNKSNITTRHMRNKLEIYSISNNTGRKELLGWITLDRDMNKYYNNVYDANSTLIGELDSLHDGRDYVTNDGSIAHYEFIDYE
jgi:hypothetical protein